MTKLYQGTDKFNRFRLIVSGDSWTYGSEIRDPLLPNTVNDWDEPNDSYRIPRIWPTKLGNLLGTNDVVNLSYPAASNDRIVRHTVGWLTENYISNNVPTDNIFVIVGLTSPERKDFYYRDDNNNFWFTLWPMWEHKYPQHQINTFAKLYIQNFYNVEESTHRYLNQIFYLQNFFKNYKIKHLFFQAFYQKKDLHIQQWKDVPYVRNYNGQPDQIIWNLIDPITFMHKNDEIHSFHNFIKNKDSDPNFSNAIKGMHPSEQGHTWWAEHIYEYIKEHKLW